MWNKIKIALRHNQFLALALVVILAIGVWLIGCNSTVVSPINPPKKVTKVELEAELEYMATLVEIAFVDLARQDAFKKKLFEIGLVAAQGGTVNPAGAAISLLGICGLGAIADNRRKDSIIKTLQNKGA